MSNKLDGINKMITAKRRSTEALYEQQQQIQHDIRKAEEEMIDLEMRRNIEIEMVTKEENKWKQ
ncbi:TPA: hypothetical protein O1397_000041 [Staphylococcus aureus]|nr:hypothetical protein [Staphylococcus aureus]